MNGSRFIGLLVMLGGCLSAPPLAQPIAFELEGTVSGVSDDLDALPPGVAPGSVFHGAYTFDGSTPATPVGCGSGGDCADYHHGTTPAGVILRFGTTTFRSLRVGPDFTLRVRGHVDPTGMDGYGFDSLANDASGLSSDPVLDTLDFHWMVMRFGMLVDPPALPTTPPLLASFGQNFLLVQGQCSSCPGAGTFTIQARIEMLKSELRLQVGRTALSWDVPQGGPSPPNPQHPHPAFDVLRGDLGILRSAPDGFVSATLQCLAENHEPSMLSFTSDPDPGQGWWFLVREVDTDAVKSYDSTGLTQVAGRDQPIAASGADCS